MPTCPLENHLFAKVSFGSASSVHEINGFHWLGETHGLCQAVPSAVFACRGSAHRGDAAAGAGHPAGPRHLPPGSRASVGAVRWHRRDNLSHVLKTRGSMKVRKGQSLPEIVADIRLLKSSHGG